MKPNTNNHKHKNKSPRQIDRSFGATHLLVLPTSSTASPHTSAAGDVNYTNNPNLADQTQTQASSSNYNTESAPASLATNSHSRAIPVLELPAATPLHPTALLCQLASYQYVVSEQGSQSSAASRFFKPLYDAGYAYALWLANSTPAVLLSTATATAAAAAASSTELPILLAQNTMIAVQRRLTYHDAAGAGAKPSIGSSSSTSSGSPENLEIITDVPGLFTHCFYQEYASFLQSKLHYCQRQAHQHQHQADNWSKARYCNHATCQPFATTTTTGAGASNSLSSYSVGENEKDNLAFGLDMPLVIRLLFPLTPHKVKHVLAATPERLAGLRLAIQTAFTKLSPFQCQAITDYALGYTPTEIGQRRGWTAKRAGKHIYQAKRWLHAELMFSGLLSMTIPARAAAAVSAVAPAGSGYGHAVTNANAASLAAIAIPVTVISQENLLAS